jgi:hypothetical protein
MTNEIPILVGNFKMTNENFSYIQSFPVNFTGSQTDNRRTSSEKKIDDNKRKGYEASSLLSNRVNVSDGVFVT